jgi:hypothetical protein
VFVGGIVAAVVVVGVVAAVSLRRRSQDDVHSVEHYHRQLHTLEEMRTHPTGSEANNGEASYPASAFRVSTSPTVRLTEPSGSVVPPVPPLPVTDPGRAVTFDDSPDADADADADAEAEVRTNGRPENVPSTFMTGKEDRAMYSINRRPRRLAGPAAAVAAVAVLVAVLVVTGLHSNTPGHRAGKATATTVTTSHAGTHPSRPARHASASTTTTAPPMVSAPTSVSASAATYRVADASYSLELGANNGECWVDATDSTGKVLYEGVLFTGQSVTVTATGPVAVLVGAPGAFTAKVNGAAVALPPGAQAPFTLTFQPPGSTAGAGGTAGGTTGASGNSGTASG